MKPVHDLTEDERNLKLHQTAKRLNKLVNSHDLSVSEVFSSILKCMKQREDAKIQPDSPQVSLAMPESFAQPCLLQ